MWGRRGRERRAASCGLGETLNALPDTSATDIRRTRTDISTRCSVMPPLGTRRPNTRQRGCAPRAGMDEERRRGGRHGTVTTDQDGICPTRDQTRAPHTVGIRLLLLRCRARTVNFQLRPAAVAMGMHPIARGLLCAGGHHSRDGALRLMQPERGTSSSVHLTSENFLRGSGVDLPPLCRRGA